MSLGEKRCAFLTTDDLEGFFVYDHLARRPLARLGWQVDDVPWRASEVRWDDYRVVVIRSPWDYQGDPERFLEVLEEIERSSALLANSLRIVRWNIEKSYLRDLEARQVTIVPTAWRDRLTREGLDELFETLASDEIVIKPIVGANADHAFRLRRDSHETELRAAVDTFAQWRLLAQPFVDSVVGLGEFSLFWFGGAYSHAIIKRPKTGDFRVQEEHGGVIRAVDPDPDLIEAGQRAIDAVDEPLLYARVDLVRLADRRPALMELELIEPSLYFSYDAESPGRFADAVEALAGD